MANEAIIVSVYDLFTHVVHDYGHKITNYQLPDAITISCEDDDRR